MLSSLLSLGCIWDPASGTQKEDNATLYLSGWATDQGIQVDIKARNSDTGALDLITSVLSTSSDTFGDNLYAWSATLTPTQLPRKYWAPTIVGGNPAGRLEITGFQGSNAMYTFSEAAQTCTVDKMDDGETQSDAGLDCSDGNKTVLFDNSGVGLAPESVTYTTLSSKTVDGVNARVISYQSQGNTVYAAICSPLSGTGLPISVYNHGGGLGTVFAEADGCVAWAKKGWVLAMSSYRNEPLRIPATWSTAPFPVAATYTSTGALETNLGEVNDVMRLLAIAQSLPNVNVNHTLMWGGSHGGGITLRALERGARVQAAVAMFPATDWAQLYNDCVATAASPPTPDDATVCNAVNAQLQASTGGTPATRAAAYQWRSPTYFASDLKLRQDVKLLVQQGLADTLVRPSQTCSFAAQAGFPADTQWHVPNNTTPGSYTTAAATGCSQTWKGASRPTTSWPANRYFMVYDSIIHEAGPALWLDFINFANALAWSPTPL